jgi:hypothetical protein
MSRERVFISYRRSDSAGTTGLLRKSLSDALGAERVFQDVVGIDLGSSFPAVLEDQLRQAVVVLAVIGKTWLSTANEFAQRRIDFEDDWVRRELSIALSTETITVIPVLVDGAAMSPVEALPLALQALPTRNAISLHHEAFDESALRLIKRLRQLLNEEGEMVGSADAQSPPAASHGIRETIRQELAAFAKRQAAFYTIASTVDEVSRLLPAGRDWEQALVDEAALSVLLARLRWRSVADVEVHLGEVLRDRFSLKTDNGAWLGFALSSEMMPISDDDHLADVVIRKGCVLVRPDDRGRVGSIAVVSSIREGRNPGVTTTAASEVLLGFGQSLGIVDPFQHH